MENKFFTRNQKIEKMKKLRNTQKKYSYIEGRHVLLELVYTVTRFFKNNNFYLGTLWLKFFISKGKKTL